MSRFKNLLQQQEFPPVLFVLAGLLFSCPFLILSNILDEQKFFYFYLFLVWAVVIFVLYLVSLNLQDIDRKEEK